MFLHFLKLGRLESHRDVSHCLPAKDEDEDDVGLDPERVVLRRYCTVSVLRDTILQHTLLVEFLSSLVLPFSLLQEQCHRLKEILHLCPSLHFHILFFIISHCLEWRTDTNLWHELCSYSPSSPSLSLLCHPLQVRQFTSNLFNQSLSLFPHGDAKPLSSLAESWILSNLMYCKKLRTSRETVEHRNFTLSQSLFCLRDG